VCIYDVEGGRGKEQRDALMQNNLAMRIYWAHSRRKLSLTECSRFYGVSVGDVRKAIEIGRKNDRATNGKNRQLAKMVGLCVTCRVHDHRPGKSECERCAEMKKKRNKINPPNNWGWGVCQGCNKIKRLISSGVVGMHKGCPGGHQPPVEASNG
jgi:hypothetical protein